MSIWRLHIACWIPDYKHTLRLCNTHFFSTATVVVRTHFNVTLYVHWQSCFDWCHVYFCQVHHTCYVFLPSYPNRFGHPNNMLWTEQTGMDWEEAIVEAYGFDQWKHIFFVFKKDGRISFLVTKALWRQSLDRPLCKTCDPVRSCT
jgi:hypothetical protein